MEFLTQILIYKLYLAGFVGSFLIQTFFQNRFGKGTAWGISKGWQTEIAIWNVCVAVLLVAFISRNFESDLVVLALFLLSSGFVANHAFAFRNGMRASNIAGATANALGLVVITCWFLFSGK